MVHLLFFTIFIISVTKTPETKHLLLQEKNLDVTYEKYPFLRTSPDDNSKVKVDFATTNTSPYHKTCFVAVPEQKKYSNKNGELIEDKVVTDMEIAYCESLREPKSREEVFTPRNAATDSKTEKPNRPLDHVLIDESVTDVLYTHFVPRYIPWTGLYQYMKNEGLHGFFSIKSDGMYSKWAIEKHGFPPDGSSSDIDQNEREEEEEELDYDNESYATLESSNDSDFNEDSDESSDDETDDSDDENEESDEEDDTDNE